MSLVRCRAFAEIRGVEDEEDVLVVRGMASTGDLDHKGTYIDQDSMWDAAKSKSRGLPVFYNHHWHAPIGRTRSIQRAEEGLAVESAIGRGFEIPIGLGLGGITYSVDNIRKQIKQGFLNAYSVGFDGELQRKRGEEYPTVFVKSLMEVSVVSLPANDKTVFNMARSLILDREGLPPGWPNKELRFYMDEDEEEFAELQKCLRMLREI